MPFPKTAQSKGGQHPASAHQKHVAREWMLGHKPWLRATGPRTVVGVSISSANSTKHGLFRQLVILDPEQIERLQASPDYRKFTKRLELLEEKRNRKTIAYKNWLRQSFLPELLRKKNNG